MLGIYWQEPTPQSMDPSPSKLTREARFKAVKALHQVFHDMSIGVAMEIAYTINAN